MLGCGFFVAGLCVLMGRGRDLGGFFCAAQKYAILFAMKKKSGSAAEPPHLENLGDGPVLLAVAGQKIAGAWQRFSDALAENPDVWLSIVGDAQQKQMQIAAQPVNPADAGKPDRIFASAQWRENPFFSFLRRNYLLGGEMLETAIDRAPLSEEDKKLLRFAAGQYIDAVSPANFPMTNPEVLDETIKTGGQNFVAGMQNFAEDMQKGAISNTDKNAFAPGKNVAITPGKVVFQNDIMQLIEYAPQTEKVHSRPLLIVPPCINKYYILDLQPRNSLVAHAIAAGHRVFLISWVNATPAHRSLDWDFYLREGAMAAIESVRAISGQAKINALGFCIGGTMLAAALAVLANEKQRPVQSLTLLATMLDFSDSGDIGVFIDEAHVAAREKMFADGGLVDGEELAHGFAVLRPNDLIWPYIVNNYYRGHKPQAFDLLYWNSDSTNLPGPMFMEYQRAFYLENRFAKNTATFCGVRADLSTVKLPLYAVSCEKDHIVPWHAAFSSAQLLAHGAKTRFILSASGHIAGIINPPAAKKGWCRAAPLSAAAADEWRNSAEEFSGGWWDDWLQWLSAHGGRKVAAPAKQGNARYAPLEDAPGSFVCAPKFNVNNKGILK